MITVIYDAPEGEQEIGRFEDWDTALAGAEKWCEAHPEAETSGYPVLAIGPKGKTRVLVEDNGYFWEQQ